MKSIEAQVRLAGDGMRTTTRHNYMAKCLPTNEFRAEGIRKVR